MVALTCVAAALAIAPLVAILGYLLKQGAGALSIDFFTHKRGAGWPTPSSER